MKIEVPAKIWRWKSFKCTVVIKNLASTSGLGRIKLRRDSDDYEIMSQDDNWGQSGGADQTREIVFTVPSGVFKPPNAIRRNGNAEIRRNGENRRKQDRIRVEAYSYVNTNPEPRSSSEMLSRPFKIGWWPAFNFNNIDTIMILVLIALGVIVFITLSFEYDPTNDAVNAQDEFPLSQQLVVVQRPNVVVPLKYALSDGLSLGANNGGKTGTLIVAIYGRPLNTTVLGVSISPSASTNATLNSILSIDQNSSNHFNYTRNYNGFTIPIEEYRFPFWVRHTGIITNSAEPYTLTIINYNSSSGPKSYEMDFNWKVQTLDFSMIMYFWLVLAGVIFSRYVTFHSGTSTTNNVSGTLEERLLNEGKNKNPLVWIIFSAAIAVLIFAGFQGQLKSLTPIIAINISTAFAFGFGFDKVLEATKKIQST